MSTPLSNMPIGREEEAELTDLLKQVEGKDQEAEAHVRKVLSAVSGYGGMQNAAAIMGDHLADSVKEADELKAEGNRYFSEGEYAAAVDAYRKAIELFSDYGPQMLDSSAKKLLVTVYSNAAQAYLKLGAASDGDLQKPSADYYWQSAREMADMALSLEPANVKARFRRGCAFARCLDWSQARDDFEWTLRQEPGNDAAKRELRNVLKQLRGEKENASSSGMTSWEKAAGAAVKAGQCEDPRSSKASQPQGPAPINIQMEKHISMASQLKRGAAQYFESKGRSDAWKKKQKKLQQDVDLLAEETFKKVKEIEEESDEVLSLETFLGSKAEVMKGLNDEQRRRYLAADALITCIKGTFPDDFKDIVQIASTL